MIAQPRRSQGAQRGIAKPPPDAQRLDRFGHIMNAQNLNTLFRSFERKRERTAEALVGRGDVRGAIVKHRGRGRVTGPVPLEAGASTDVERRGLEVLGGLGVVLVEDTGVDVHARVVGEQFAFGFVVGLGVVFEFFTVLATGSAGAGTKAALGSSALYTLPRQMLRVLVALSKINVPSATSFPSAVFCAGIL